MNDTLLVIPIDLIDRNPAQPRRLFDGIDELAASIGTHGVIEPLLVRPIGDRFEVIAGERRLLACRAAGLAVVPVVVREATDAEAFELAIVENVVRRDLTPLEEAEAFQKLTTTGKTQAEIGRLVGKTQSYVAQKLRLLTLPPFVASFLAARMVTEGHIRQVLRLRDLYGGLQRQFRPDQTGLEDTSDEMACIVLFFLLRPEMEPITTGKVCPVTAQACRDFLGYVSEHNGTVPQWEVAALWWTAAATVAKVPVESLRKQMDLWRERQLSALAMFRGIGNGMSRLQWSYYDDLKAGGLLFGKDETLTPVQGGLLLKAFDHVESQGHVPGSWTQRRLHLIQRGEDVPPAERENLKAILAEFHAGEPS